MIKYLIKISKYAKFYKVFEFLKSYCNTFICKIIRIYNRFMYSIKERLYHFMQKFKQGNIIKIKNYYKIIFYFIIFDRRIEH